MSLFDEGCSEVAGLLAREAEHAVMEARRALGEAESRASVAQQLRQAVEKGWPAHVLALYRKHKDWIRVAADWDPGFRTVLEGLQRQAEKKVAEQRDLFPRLIEEAAERRKLPLDRTSRHPRYTFVEGFFTLQVEDGRSEVLLRDYESDLARVPADVEAVLDVLEREHRRVFGRRFDGKVFLAKLRRHYLAVIGRESGKDGDPLPIRRVTKRLGKNEKGFRTDEFAADLARLVKDGPREIDGRTLELQQTKDDQQGMLLPGLASRGLVGFLVFREGASA